MLDHVPVRVWLLIAIAAAAYAPTRYIFSHFNQRTSARDIMQSAQSLDHQTSGSLTRNLVFLVALIALAAFIYTPAAAQFAQSPTFWPILMAACGAWSLFTVFKGATNGKIEPFARGFNNTYERHLMPKRFWASMTWNALFGLMCFWIGFQMIGQESLDICYDRLNNHSPQDEITACNKLIRTRKNGDGDLANLLAARGTAYHRLGDYEHAMIDYTAALRLDPHDSASHYNRGLISQQRGDVSGAVAEFRAAVREDPNNAEAHQQLTEAEKAKRDSQSAQPSRP